MHPDGLLSESSKVAYIDLHVRQRNEHVLCDGCVLTEVQPLPILRTTVKTEERIPIIPRGEYGDILQQGIIFDLVKTAVTTLTRPTMECRMLCSLRWWRRFPGVHLDRPNFDALEWLLRLVLRIGMPRGKALVARRTVE